MGRKVKARIIGTGSYTPPRRMTNADFEKIVDTSDEWIVTRTGIRERRIGHSTAALAVDAGRAALEHAEVGGADVDLLLLCTSTPDQTLPATSAQVETELGIAGGAMDHKGVAGGSGPPGGGQRSFGRRFDFADG